MKIQPTKPREEDIDKVASIVTGLLAIGVPVALICERLEIRHGKEHWWWKQKRKRDQDSSRSHGRSMEGGIITERLEFKWYWCETCDGPAIECPVCGNNCCNGSYGTLQDGKECPYCVLAYQYQDLGWNTSTMPKLPEDCVGIWKKVTIPEGEQIFAAVHRWANQIDRINSWHDFEIAVARRLR